MKEPEPTTQETIDELNARVATMVDGIVKTLAGFVSALTQAVQAVKGIERQAQELQAMLKKKAGT